MTKPFQENLNEKIMKKRKKSQKNMENTKRRYDAMKEHNYFHDSKKKSCRWPDETVNCNEEITNDNDEFDSSLDWFMNLSSSDEEEDLTDIPLSLLIKRELEKDLQKKVRFCLIIFKCFILQFMFITFSAKIKNPQTI